jgi:acetylglutamate synthase
MPGEPAALTPRDLVLRFLASIGRPSEAEQYLRLFQSEHPEQFAIVHVAEPVMDDGVDALVAGLRYLHALGLHPVLVFGVLGPRTARRNAERMAAALVPEVPALVVTPDRVAATVRAGVVALCPLLEDADGDRDEAGRFDALAELASRLATTKLIFVGRRSGLQPSGGRVVSMVDVSTSDASALAPALPAAQRRLLAQVERLFARIPHRFTVSVTSALDLMRELFTVKGAGTLLRKGSVVTRVGGWAEVDRARVRALVEEAFGKPLVAGFEDRPVSGIYLADDYRGAAVMTPTALGPYLSKFAVTTIARGEGIGRDRSRSRGRGP